MTNFYIDENEIKENSRKITSPSGKYVLNIRAYSTKEKCWAYSRGTVLRLSDNVEICDIKRNYTVFHHSFVNKNGQEWLITGRSYLSQTIVNLDTKEEFENANADRFNFCWAQCYLSPDGNTLIVDGCHWAAPYEYKFFDFSNPSAGWPELQLETLVYSDDKEPSFNPDGTIICYGQNKWYKPLGKFENDLTDEELDLIGDEYDKRNNWEYKNQIILKREDNKMIIREGKTS